MRKSLHWSRFAISSLKGHGAKNSRLCKKQNSIETAMKITGTRSYIDVDFGNKSVRIEGELTAEPAFYATISSIKCWKTTNGMIPINNKERDWIVAEIRRHNNPQFEIIFED